jgi:hypothetical protein
MEIINFQEKRWQVISKVKIHLADDAPSLKKNYNCDLVIKNRTHYFILNEIIDVKYEKV